MNDSLPTADGASPDARPPLRAGDRLGPYEIQGLLGAGGMGEVYRARDPRLRRDVAVKVLHGSFTSTADHIDRLLREARAAGSLNHPNILTVFDVGAEGDQHYVVSELLEGESLRDRLARSPVSYRRALEYGMQIAQALGAAHEKGIWHRDVKPGNVFITGDGRVKLLDFGLVKVEARRGGGPEESTADGTLPGGVHGTLGYMSPEQLLGEEVDARTDLFALGAVLYEMFGGVPAFRRGSASETTRAVLSEEPVDLLELNASLPPAAVTVVRRCVEKNREERYQSARDLAFHLQQLLLAATAGSSRSTRRAVRSGVLLLAALGVGALLAVAGFLGFGWRPSAPTFDQLTFHRGRIGGARLSDGAAIIFSETREGRPLELWWLSGPDSPEPRYLGHRGADVLAVRAGKLALSTGRRFLSGERFVGTLAEAPVGEGSPRDLAADVEDADFDASGREYVVARSSGAGTETRLEYPVGHVLYRTSGSIRHPRFSPDGRRIAFLEDPTGRGAGGMVVLLDLDGRRMPLTESWASARGIAWSPTGNEVWFAAGESRSSRALRAVDLQRHERVLLRTPASLTLWDVASDGRVLLSRDEERSALVGVPPGESTERDLSWFDSSGLADLSDDGLKVLFDDRFGLYVRGTDGSPAVLLGLRDGFGDDFSPDGRRVLATTALARQLVVLPSGLGEPVLLPDHGITTHRGALWFPDGRRLLFTGAPPGRNARTYVQDLEGGAPRALTPENVWALSISPDGEWVAAIGAEPGIVLWPVASEQKPRPVPSSLPGDRPVAWSADGRSLWVFRRGEVPAEVWQLDVATGRRQLWKKLQPPDPDGVYSINDFRVTRDGRAYAYSYKRVVSQLYLAKGVR